MTQEAKSVAFSRAAGERAKWQTPELHRIDASTAETGGGIGADGGFS